MQDTPSLPPLHLRRCVARLGLPETVALNWELLELALTHSSVARRNNEQLEFLGDAVLRLAAAEFLMERYPEAMVGELSAVRSHLVSDRTLTSIAERLGLEPFLQISNSAAGDRAARPSRLADMVEAILAVLYLSRKDLSLVRPWLDPHLERLAETIRQNPAQSNPKTALQELTQKLHKALPEYRLQEVSRLHGDPNRYRAEVWFQDQCWGVGLGRSRKMAEQAAAQEAYQAMQLKMVVLESPPPVVQPPGGNNAPPRTPLNFRDSA
ncbi:MAG: ribonuclease III [Leptolyngbyaceae cyanobacterium T60_A2020_046]|nr:ribonuclease III [Leptolyngbyaceae cyanobacterium T60_A2020_046]